MEEMEKSSSGKKILNKHYKPFADIGFTINSDYIANINWSSQQNQSGYTIINISRNGDFVLDNWLKIYLSYLKSLKNRKKNPFRFKRKKAKYYRAKKQNNVN